MNRKQIVKRVLIGIGTVALAVILLVAFLSIRHAIKSEKEEALIQHAYGEYFTLSTGERMNYTFYDSKSEEVAVILPGFGCPTVHYDFDALAKRLNSNYKIVIVEPLGYGLSDGTARERTAENYCAELHELMCALKYDSYTIIGHSISGLYALAYCNMYEDEVKAFIGIDASVPKQIDILPEKELPEMQYKTTKSVRSFLVNTGIYRLWVEKNFDSAVAGIPTLTEEDKVIMQALYCHETFNDTQLNELKLMEENLKNLYSDTFPNSIPVLYLLSYENQNQMPGWQMVHEGMSANEKSEIIVVRGSHSLHFTSLDAVVRTIFNWD